MANPHQLTSIPDDLIRRIISLMPTPIAYKLAILRRRFLQLWRTSPSVDIAMMGLPPPRRENFRKICYQSILCRDPFDPLVSLRLNLNCRNVDPFGHYLASLLEKAKELNVQNLTILGLSVDRLARAMPIIFTSTSIRSLSLEPFPLQLTTVPEFDLSLPNLKTLSLNVMYSFDCIKLNKLLSQMPILEELVIKVRFSGSIRLSSGMLKMLNITLIASYPYERHILGLSLPKLESLRVEHDGKLRVPTFSENLPCLKEAVISFGSLEYQDQAAVDGLLNCVSRVKDLSLHLREALIVKFPTSLFLETKIGAPEFPNMKRLDVIACCHVFNIKSIAAIVSSSPVLQTVKIIHEAPQLTGSKRGRGVDNWVSKLLQKVVYRENLSEGDEREKFINFLTERASQ